MGGAADVVVHRSLTASLKSGLDGICKAKIIKITLTATCEVDAVYDKNVLGTDLR